MPTEATAAYPGARSERDPPASFTPTLAPTRSLTPPRSRFFTVEMGAQANRRGTVSTPRLIGPAIVQSVIIKHRTAADPPIFGFEVGWATSSITEFQELLTATKGWNALCERLRHAYETPIPGLIGGVQVNAVGANGIYISGIDRPLLVTAPEFFLTMTYHNVSAATNPFACWVEANILENIAPEVAANFH
jgi:hypothetical protein